MTAVAIDAGKLRYLRALRQRDDHTPAEAHEVAMADAAYGDGWWLPYRERAWRASARTVGLFRTRTGRWPSARADDPEERTLSTWLQNCRTSAGGGKGHVWTADREAFIDKVAPGWRGVRNTLRGQSEAWWQANAEATGDFSTANGRWPSPKATDQPERRLGLWLANQRTAARGTGSVIWNPERQSFLDRVAPGWQGTRKEQP